MHCYHTKLPQTWQLKTFLGAAAAAKSLQSCPTLCDPIDGSPLGSPVPGILQARTLEWVAISFSNAWKQKVKVKLLSRVRLLATPWTAAHQTPPSMRFSRQDDWIGVPLPSPFPRWLSGKESACQEGDPSLIPGSGRSPGGGHSNPLQYSCLKNPMDRGACRAKVHGGHKESDTTEWLSTSQHIHTHTHTCTHTPLLMHEHMFI